MRAKSNNCKIVTIAQMFIFMWCFIYRSRSGCLNSLLLKPGFHIVVSVVSVVSVIRKKFIGQIQLYGNLPYKCSMQKKPQIQLVVRDRMNSNCPMNSFRTIDTTIWKPGLKLPTFDLAAPSVRNASKPNFDVLWNRKHRSEVARGIVIEPEVHSISIPKVAAKAFYLHGKNECIERNQQHDEVFKRSWINNSPDAILPSVWVFRHKSFRRFRHDRKMKAVSLMREKDQTHYKSFIHGGNTELKQQRQQRQQKLHMKINIWEMVSILWLLLLPRILYCGHSMLQMDW